MNHVALIGRLTKEVAVHQTDPHSRQVLRNTLAVQNIYRLQDGQQQTDFVQVVAFGKMAERIARFVKKGDRLAVEGRLHSRHYTNREQQEVYVTEVVVEEVFFLEPKVAEEKVEAAEDLTALFCLES